jgi:hypothetical protein
MGWAKGSDMWARYTSGRPVETDHQNMEDAARFWGLDQIAQIA